MSSIVRHMKREILKNKGLFEAGKFENIVKQDRDTRRGFRKTRTVLSLHREMAKKEANA